jgi:sporulation protein YlmC with PRC-barrel domain
MDHPKRELKYVDARALNGFAARLDGAEVYGADGEKLGVVEGFIMDVQQGRPRHVVVAAGWFIHKRFLLPIGHVTLSPDGTTLSADIVKERVESFPGFNKGEFEKLEGDDFDELDQMMASVTAGVAVTELNDHYTLPAGWDGQR